MYMYTYTMANTMIRFLLVIQAALVSSQQIGCSFPFTYNGGLIYSCTQKDTNSDEVGCFSENRVWITCPPFQLVSSKESVGCWSDAEPRDLPYEYLDFPGVNTLDYCLMHCLNKGYRYAGAQYGLQCFCGNSYGQYGPSTGCDVVCPGDNNSETICGGVWSNSVMSTGLDYNAKNVTIDIDIPTFDIPTPVVWVGNWIVVQQRIDNSTDFGRNWAEYRNGFGVYNFNYWMGLEKMHQLTTSGARKLRVEVYYPTLQQWRSAEYSSFVIDDEANNYALHVGGFTGDADNGLLWSADSTKMHDGMPFSTPDVDNDKDPKRHCANIFSSGWWFNACNYVDLNGHIEAPSSAHNYFEYYINGIKTAVGMSRMMIQIQPPSTKPPVRFSTLPQVMTTEGVDPYA